MNKDLIVKQTEDYVRKSLEGEGSGHDWWHILRVWNLAKYIAAQEKNVDIFIIELGALLHDIADWKFYKGDEHIGSKTARKWLEKINVDEQEIRRVWHIIENISFKGAEVENKMSSEEGYIVQDADRLDAVGAIGIARTFAYSGHVGREIYKPDIKPAKHTKFEQYKNSNSPSINHFYEKLLLLKDRMNTKTGKKIAERRHIFMEQFLDEFYREWEGQY